MPSFFFFVELVWTNQYRMRWTQPAQPDHWPTPMTRLGRGARMTRAGAAPQRVNLIKATVLRELNCKNGGRDAKGLTCFRRSWRTKTWGSAGLAMLLLCLCLALCDLWFRGLSLSVPCFLFLFSLVFMFFSFSQFVVLFSVLHVRLCSFCSLSLSSGFPPLVFPSVPSLSPVCVL